MQMQPLPRHPVLLSRARKWSVHGVGLGLWLSGIVWLGWHYFGREETEFGPAPSPFEHWSLVLHGLFAFAAIWVFGMLWSAHVTGAWKTKRHRASGIATFAAVTVLIASGYLLYYAGSDELRSAVSVVHWTLGLALPVPFLWHRLAKRH